MNMKYLKTIIFEFIVLLSLLLINTCLYYFNIISDNTNNIFEIFIFIITFILTGIYISRRCNNKNYLEGLKISGINIILFLLLSLLFRYKLNIKIIIYYLLIIIFTVIGSLIGKFLKKKK